MSFQELLKHCTEERYRCELKEALDSMLELLKSVNDSMHQIAITGYQVLTLIEWTIASVDARFMRHHYTIKTFITLSTAGQAAAAVSRVDKNPVSTERYSSVWYGTAPIICVSTLKRVPNNLTIPILVTLSLGYQAVPKRPKRVEPHTLQSLDCKQAKSCFKCC